VHCALSLVVTLAGLAGLFLQLNAQFVGFAQILVYIGAVAILIVFAILLTRGAESPTPAPITTATPWAVSIAVAAFVTIAGAVLKSTAVWQSAGHVLVQVGPNRMLVPMQTAAEQAPTVSRIGSLLMQRACFPRGDWVAAHGRFDWRCDHRHAREAAPSVRPTS
jgi:NADH-quinone oxidoreductase subunit J